MARTAWISSCFVATASYMYSPWSTSDSVFTNFGLTSFVGRLNQGYLLDDRDPICTTMSNNSLTSITGRILLVSSLQDEIIRPTESAFFSRVVYHYTSQLAVDIHSVCDTDLWERDTIGLRRLLSRLYWYRSDSQHGPLPMSDYSRVIAPFLRGVENEAWGKDGSIANLTTEWHCEQVNIHVLV